MVVRVSVIIPCYRDAATLGRAVQSVIVQTHPSIEIIVVNDCSPESEKIEFSLAKYPQVNYIRNSDNVGLAATRNIGLYAASGEVVAFLDADDEYHPDKITVQLNALEPDTVVTCGLTLVYPNGRRVDSNGPSRAVGGATRLLYRNTLNGAGLLASRKLLLEHGGYDPTLRSCEDFDLWLRLLSSGIKVKNVDRPLYLYHFNPAGLSKDFRNISNWEMEVIQRHASRMGEEWRCTYEHACVTSVSLLRHLMRSELTNDQELRNQTVARDFLLDGFPVFKASFRQIVRSRIVYWVARLLRWRGSLRSGGS